VPLEIYCAAPAGGHADPTNNRKQTGESKDLEIVKLIKAMRRYKRRGSKITTTGGV
jgi:hypothetical protein